MNLFELKDELKRILPHGWEVMIDEAHLVNLDVDTKCRCEGFAYIEEFYSGTTTFNMGARVTNRYEVTFMRFVDIEPSAELREHIRLTQIWPVVYDVQKQLNRNYGVASFNTNTLPRGFDANEVLVSMEFSMEESIC